MGPRDPHRFVNELDDATVERLIARLESRAKDTVFNSLFDKYVTRLKLPLSAHVLEVGCGTGTMLRALARRPDFAGKAMAWIRVLRSSALRGASHKRNVSATDWISRLAMPISCPSRMVASTLSSRTP